MKFPSFLIEISLFLIMKFSSFLLKFTFHFFGISFFLLELSFFLLKFRFLFYFWIAKSNYFSWKILTNFVLKFSFFPCVRHLPLFFTSLSSFWNPFAQSSQSFRLPRDLCWWSYSILPEEMWNSYHHRRDLRLMIISRALLVRERDILFAMAGGKDVCCVPLVEFQFAWV